MLTSRKSNMWPKHARGIECRLDHQQGLKIYPSCHLTNFQFRAYTSFNAAMKPGGSKESGGDQDRSRNVGPQQCFCPYVSSCFLFDPTQFRRMRINGGVKSGDQLRSLFLFLTKRSDSDIVCEAASAPDNCRSADGLL